MNSSSSKGLFSWALFDWANSAYFVIIQTFIFSAYFAKAIADEEITGTEQWGTTIGLAGLCIALLAPFLGAIADHTGRRKPWIGFFSIMCILACGALWFAKPDSSFLLFALVAAFFATVGAEFAFIFYSAMLPDLVPPERMGRWSGWSWGLGYAGGLVCLLIALYGFVESDGAWLNLNTDESEHVRATFVLTAVWYALFSLPMFFRTPDVKSTGVSIVQASKMGLEQLITSIRHMRSYKNIAWFLLARMIYNDGLTLIFSFGGVYAAGTFDMDTAEIIAFGILLNISSGVGAFAFSWFDDKAGSKATICWSLVGLIIPITAILIVESKMWFQIWALIMGIFIGPVQAASRTLIGRMAPEELRNQMFGLFALSGKATAFIGPFLVGMVTVWLSSQRWGMSIILLLLVIGLVMMVMVKEPTNELKPMEMDHDT